MNNQHQSRFMKGAIASFLTLCVSTLASAQEPELMGDWLATLETPNGALRLQISIETGDDGQPEAVLQSLDQAPGQLIPISRVAISPSRFSFEIAAIGASFDGEWVDASNSYEGIFNQGMSLPAAFARPGEHIPVHIEGLDGVWQGHLSRADTELEFRLNITSDEAGSRASLDSITQAAYDIPVTELSRTGNQIRFRVPAANVTYTAQITGDHLAGVWSRPGFDDTVVNFERTAHAVTGPNRPQTPQEPFPYHVEEVSIPNPEADGVVLAGTLTRPDGPGPFPGVVLISGSGPQDRDETVWTHQPFAVLADFLTRNGVAVLRYDDRGFAASSGEFGPATSLDFASDARAVAHALAARPDISVTGLAGHSEGGLIAPIVAAEDDGIDFIILLAGPGTPGHQFIVDQSVANARAMGMDPENIDHLAQALTRIVDLVRNAGSEDAARTALDATLNAPMMSTLQVPEDQRTTFIRMMTRDWNRTLLEYDPAAYLPRVEQPVLALQGTLDLQIVAEPNVAGLEAMLADHPDAEIVVLEGRNHLFQHARTGLMTEYAQIEETMDPEVMQIIANWINVRFGAER